MKIFWTLVKNDLKVFRNRQVSRQWRVWRWVYLGLILAAGFIAYTILLLNGLSRPELMSYGIPSMFISFLIFLSLFSAISTVKQEWRADTVGWWLSLPYSRAYLLGAKFIASLLRAIKVALAFSLVLFAFWLEAAILRPDVWPIFSLGSLYARLAEGYGLFLLICPLIITLGILLSVMSKSKLRPAIPLIWFFFMVSYSILYSWIPRNWGGYNSGKRTSSLIWFHLVPGEHIMIIASLFAAVLLFWGAVNLLERQVEL